MILVRWKAGEPRRGLTFGPLDGEHPLAAVPCPECGLPLRIPWGVPVVLVAVGPPDDDDEARQRHEAGRWYTAAATVLHEPCVDELGDDALDSLVAQLVTVDVADLPGVPS